MSVRWPLFLAGISLMLAGLASPTDAAHPSTPASDFSTPAVGPSAPATTPSAPATGHPIGVRVVDGNGELFDRRTGERFVVRGTNYVFTPLPGGRRTPVIFPEGLYDPERVRADLAALAARGYNTVRVFLDLCAPPASSCIGRVDGEGLDPAYLANVADLTHAAADAGLVVFFTSNDLPDHGGYVQAVDAAAGPEFGPYRNRFYLTPAAIEATRRYWRDIISGLGAQGARLDVVLAWSLLNEQWMFIDEPPLSLASGEVRTTTGRYDMAEPGAMERMVAEGMNHYIRELKEEILALDPTALVAMGFFLPEAAPGWYTDPVSALAGSDLDLLDLHAYPGTYSMAQHARSFQVAEHPGKPVILGEYGAFRSAYPDIESAASVLADWQASSCEEGFDGWLHWSFRSADPAVGDVTWGLTDADGYLLDLLAPDDNPDPCTLIEVPRSNRAIGARARASSSIPGERASRAVDDSLETAWVAGAHPRQWLRIDLPDPVTLADMQLVVSQDPAGRTIHAIEVLKDGRGGFRRAGRLVGRTQDGDVLVFRPRTPIRDVRSIRVTTTRSPSWVAWREVRVFEEPQ